MLTTAGMVSPVFLDLYKEYFHILSPTPILSATGGNTTRFTRSKNGVGVQSSPSNALNSQRDSEIATGVGVTKLI